MSALHGCVSCVLSQTCAVALCLVAARKLYAAKLSCAVTPPTTRYVILWLYPASLLLLLLSGLANAKTVDISAEGDAVKVRSSSSTSYMHREAAAAAARCTGKQQRARLALQQQQQEEEGLHWCGGGSSSSSSPHGRCNRAIQQRGAAARQQQTVQAACVGNGVPWAVLCTAAVQSGGSGQWYISSRAQSACSVTSEGAELCMWGVTPVLWHLCHVKGKPSGGSSS
jgi:hypothetical protein